MVERQKDKGKEGFSLIGTLSVRLEDTSYSGAGTVAVLIQREAGTKTWASCFPQLNTVVKHVCAGAVQESRPEDTVHSPVT